jgi:hypothetical protein
MYDILQNPRRSDVMLANKVNADARLRRLLAPFMGSVELHR